ncbi:MAG: glycosyltransferase family 39 protein, partial [Anaerolineales bacterium]
MNLSRDRFYMLVLLLTSSALRLINIGYSDYQGDEIKAFFIPETGQTWLEFLLDQRKGPLQFVVTGILGLFDPQYNNQLLIRLPFALAGVAAVAAFYLLLKRYFSLDVAFFAALFFATNGFLVSFARIVQYQSFVILFMILAVYWLDKAVRDSDFHVRGLYLGLLAWALAILFHYDGVFIAPIMFYLLYRWFRVSDQALISQLRPFIFAGSIAALLLAIFYIPFVISLSQSTLNYWSARVSEEASTRISSSTVLFSVYQPIYTLKLYTILSAVGVIAALGYLLARKFNFMGKITDRMSEFEGLTWENLLVFAGWIVLPYAFMEVLVYNPGTHIYSYLIPALIFPSFGLAALKAITRLLIGERIGAWLAWAGVLGLFGFLFAQSYSIFVDHRYEYPWEDEPFLVWTISKPNTSLQQDYHLALFGFPYYRNWESVRDYILTAPPASGYTTNERRTIARF